MAYEKQTWACGEIITADKMNHIENGIKQLSDNSGSVSIIKLGRFNVYGSSQSESAPYYYVGGGGTLEDSKTLADLVGDKTIINYDIKPYNSDSSANKPEFIGDVQTSGGTDYNRIPLLIFPKEHYDKITALNVSGFVTGYEAYAVQAVEIYAICI